MSRLPDLRRDDLDDEGRAVWDQLTGSRREALVTERGSLVGPFNAWVTAPGLGRRLGDLGGQLRFATSLGGRLTELAIVTVGAHHRAEFEWYAHARLAREQGIGEDVLDAIAEGTDPPLDDERDRVAHAVAAALCRTGRIPADLYSRAAAVLGDRGLVELVTLCGYYVMVSFQLNAFEVPLPPGVAARWA